MEKKTVMVGLTLLIIAIIGIIVPTMISNQSGAALSRSQNGEAILLSSQHKMNKRPRRLKHLYRIDLATNDLEEELDELELEDELELVNEAVGQIEVVDTVDEIIQSDQDQKKTNQFNETTQPKRNQSDESKQDNDNNTETDENKNGNSQTDKDEKRDPIVEDPKNQKDNIVTDSSKDSEKSDQQEKKDVNEDKNADEKQNENQQEEEEPQDENPTNQDEE